MFLCWSHFQLLTDCETLLYSLQYKCLLCLIYRPVWSFWCEGRIRMERNLFSIIWKTSLTNILVKFLFPLLFPFLFFSMFGFAGFLRRKAVNWKWWVLLGSNIRLFGKAKLYLRSLMCFWQGEFRLNSSSFLAASHGKVCAILGFVHERVVVQQGGRRASAADSGVVCSQVLSQETSPGLAELLGLVNTDVADNKY